MVWLSVNDDSRRPRYRGGVPPVNGDVTGEQEHRMVFMYITLGICAVLAAGLVYRYDLFEKEPWYMVLLAMTAGGLVMSTMGVIENGLLDLAGEPPRPAWLIAIVAGGCEELAKLALVIGIAVLARRHFNDPMDGIIYGSLVGLGMAVEESLYFMRINPPAIDRLPNTEFIRLAGHLVFGGIAGFGVGMIRMRMRGAVVVLMACFAVAFGLHMAWDWIAFTAMYAGRMSGIQTALAVAIMLSGMLLYGRLVVVGNRWSKRVFAPDADRTVWGFPFG